MDASIFGFHPDNKGEDNLRALQAAVDSGGVTEVTQPGIYDVGGTLYLRSGSRLRFREGVILRRVSRPSGKNGYFLINRGAFTGEYDEDIEIDGLTLCVNGVESAAALSVDILPELMEQGEDALNDYFDDTILGLRGQLSFMYVRGLKIKNFTMSDLCAWDYGVHISDFENIELDTVRIEGNKDAIHFGPGRNFILRNGTFRTKDDPIALNADDYSPSAPTFGTIENGRIENCIDLEQNGTYGYFVRLLIGSAVEWTRGMTVSHSEAVIHNGRFYRAVLPADGTEKCSVTPPTHEKGFRVLDGIAWVRTHIGYKPEELPRAAEIKNVTFRGLTSEKTRDTSVILYIADNQYRKGRRENAPVPFARNITFDDLRITGSTANAFLLSAPFENLTVKNSALNGAAVRFEQGSCGTGKYPASFTFDNVRDFRFDDGSAFCDRDADSPAYKTKY